jgi:hypothetical protein
MPILRTLDEEETEIFLHLVKNKGRTMDNDKNRTNELIDNDCSDGLKEKLSKISEEENYAMKNRYQFDKETMNYADKTKMPIDKSKVKDLLRHQNIFR